MEPAQRNKEGAARAGGLRRQAIIHAEEVHRLFAKEVLRGTKAVLRGRKQSSGGQGRCRPARIRRRCWDGPLRIAPAPSALVLVLPRPVQAAALSRGLSRKAARHDARQKATSPALLSVTRHASLAPDNQLVIVPCGEDSRRLPCGSTEPSFCKLGLAGVCLASKALRPLAAGAEEPPAALRPRQSRAPFAL